MKANEENNSVSSVHLDALGGIAGDMFSAALLDVLPEIWSRCEKTIAAFGLPAEIETTLTTHNDGIFSGSRFIVAGLPENNPTEHHHVHWEQLRKKLQTIDLEEDIRATTLGIFTLLAEAEASVHGVKPESVAFHEVGAYDSIIDILSAATIITHLNPCQWTIGPIPSGNGLINTEHGIIPIPAPATLELLKGYNLYDDGEEGERVTPTGAAILRYLNPSQSADSAPKSLLDAGVGFGTRKLRSRSNILRATLYASTGLSTLETTATDSIEILRCEIDDQTGEDLAVAVSHIRATDGVLDICQWPVYAKKGRIATALQVLTRPDATDGIIIELFNETTTLGIRRSRQTRHLLKRENREIDGLNVKLAQRPSGISAKMELDDLSALRGVEHRRAVRSKTEAEALNGDETDGE